MLLVEIPNALSPEKCVRLIDLFGANVVRSKIGLPGRRYASALRTSASVKLEVLPEDIGTEALVTQVSKLPASHNERWDIVRYRKGEEFKPHYDRVPSPHPNGQRQFTVLLYLRAPEKGGETFFPVLDAKVVPQQGKLVVWSNMMKDGALDKESLHTSLPVEAGEKWVLVTWVRSLPYDYASDTWIER